MYSTLSPTPKKTPAPSQSASQPPSAPSSAPSSPPSGPADLTLPQPSNNPSAAASAETPRNAPRAESIQRSPSVKAMFDGPIPFENRALLNAVRHVSNDLVKRSTLSVSDPHYASLLSDILGRSHYATIERLAHQRRLSTVSAEHVSPSRASSSASSAPSSPADKRRRTTPRPSDRDLDKLVARLRAPRPAPDGERSLTADIATRPGATLDVEALRRLWGVPKVVADVAGLGSYLQSAPRDGVLALYDRLIGPASSDARVFNLLVWAERCAASEQMRRASPDRPCGDAPDGAAEATSCDGGVPGLAGPPDDQRESIRSVSRSIVADVVRALLTKRPSPFFARHMDVAVETVLYAIHPDRFVPRFRATMLRDASFCRGLQAYEYSWSYEGSLENLAKGRLNRMLKDIRAVRALDPPPTSRASAAHSASASSPTQQRSGGATASEQKNSPVSAGLSLRAVREYCADRDTLTDRALCAVHDRYVRRRRSGRVRTRVKRENGRHSVGGTSTLQPACLSPTAPTNRSWSHDDARMTVGDFVRMYLALVGCGSDPGLKYWFSVLDQDGDGLVGVGDVAHFYAERKAESERRNGVLLADVHWLWVRLCAMSGVPPDGPGLDLNAFKCLRKEEREFVMCALLVRRVDDGKLADVASTIRASGDAGTMRIGAAM